MTLTDFLLARIAEDEAAVKGFHQGADPDFFWGPDRIRAECEAKRRIVEECQGQGDQGPSAAALADIVLCNLAAIYADHPDYRESWRP